jgi:hypothetical protein
VPCISKLFQAQLYKIKDGGAKELIRPAENAQTEEEAIKNRGCESRALRKFVQNLTAGSLFIQRKRQRE